MALARWSSAETARRLEVSAASISAYINGTQVPPAAKINLLRLAVDHFLNMSSLNEHGHSTGTEHPPGYGPLLALAAGKNKTLREIRLEALLSRIESLAAGLRHCESEQDKVEAAKELASLASKLAETLPAAQPSKNTSH